MTQVDRLQHVVLVMVGLRRVFHVSLQATKLPNTINFEDIQLLHDFLPEIFIPP